MENLYALFDANIYRETANLFRGLDQEEYIDAEFDIPCENLPHVADAKKHFVWHKQGDNVI